MSSNPPKRRPVIDVYVSDHARARARERFPGFKAARIVDEVREALLDGRVSPHKPDGVFGPAHRDCLYVWTEDGDRIYPIKACDNGFVVTTTVARGIIPALTKGGADAPGNDRNARTGAGAAAR